MPSLKRVRACGGAVVLAALTLAAPARAEEAEADRLFREGQEQLEKGHFTAACALFDASLKKEQAIGTLVNLAYCHEKDNKPVQAWNEFKRVEGKASRDLEGGAVGRPEFVKEHLAALEHKIGHVHLYVGSHRIEEVKLDGEPTMLDDRGRIAAEPGTHVILVSVEGNETARKSNVYFRVGGNNPEIRLTFESDAAPVATAAPPPTSSEPKVEARATGSGKGGRTAGIVLASVGAASFGVALGFYAETLRLKHLVKTDGQSGSQRLGHAWDLSYVATTLDVVGSATLATGILLIALSGSSAPKTNGGARIVPLAGANGAGLRLEGTW